MKALSVAWQAAPPCRHGVTHRRRNSCGYLSAATETRKSQPCVLALMNPAEFRQHHGAISVSKNRAHLRHRATNRENRADAARQDRHRSGSARTGGLCETACRSSMRGIRWPGGIKEAGRLRDHQSSCLFADLLELPTSKAASDVFGRQL